MIQNLLQKQRLFFSSNKTKDYEFRRRQLELLKKIIIDNEEKIMEATRKDLNRPEAETYIAETIFLIKEINHTIKKLKSWMKPKCVSTIFPLLPGCSRIVSEPFGVSLIIAPWNYPVQLAISPAIAAIAAGNCVIIKPSEMTPASSKLIAEMISKNFPEEFFAVVEGGVEETTALLNEKFDFIFYTGSTAVGRIVMQAAAKNLTPVVLELGGKSPCVIDETANLKVAAQRIVWGKYVNCGQTCVAPDYILVHQSIRDPFIEAMRETLNECYGKQPTENKDYAAIVNSRHYDRIKNLMKDEKFLTGGECNEAQRKIAPTLIDLKSDDSPLMKDEIFGPLLPVKSYNHISEALDFINKRPKPLALYVFSKDKRTQQAFLSGTSSGGLVFNDVMVHLGVTDLPFGGVGDSGIGSYHGKHGFDAFSHHKSVLRRPFWGENKLRYPPYKKTFPIVRKLYNFLYR